jgi:hypothetical protein
MIKARSIVNFWPRLKRMRVSSPASSNARAAVFTALVTDDPSFLSLPLVST